MPVARRLAVLLAIPLAATVLFAAWGVVSTGRQALTADRLATLVAVSSATGEVLAQLDRERQLAVVLVAGPGAGAEGANGFLEQVAASDRAVAAYRHRREVVGESNAGAGLVGLFDEQLRLLPALREQVRARLASVTAVSMRYRVAIGQGLAVREAVGQVGGADGVVADQLRVAAALSQVTELAALQQIAVMGSAGGVLTPAAQREFAANRAGYEEALLVATHRSSVRWRLWLDQALTGERVLSAQRLDDEVARARVGQRLRVDLAGWSTAGGERRDRLGAVRARVDADIVAEVGRQRTAQWVTTGVLTGVAVLLIAVAGVVASRQGRALAARLRSVRDAVTQVAHQELPDLVRRVKAADPTDPGSMPPPPEPLAPARPPRDEVDEVTVAFDTLASRVYVTATDLARQQQVAAAVVEAVGRRSQLMTHRLTVALDQAERDEADPKTLGQLFGLDSLVAQLGHSTQGLLVLSGLSLGTVHEEPVALMTVVQAAQSRIQEYQRVVAGMVDERVLVPPKLIDDLVHLLTSLLDNATRFSPGDALVSGHLLGDRVVVQVVDAGAGIKPDLLAQLNGELARPAPTVGVEHIRRQGLATVALLAAAHGLMVRLVPGQPCGTVAEVTIPTGGLQIIAAPQGVMPAGPIVGRRAPGGTPASTLTLPAAPVDAPRREAAAYGWGGVSSADAPTQALQVLPAPRHPMHGETARRMPAPPPSWFVPGASVHLATAPPTPSAADTTTVHGLPRRQPNHNLTPPPAPALSAVPPPRPGGLASTAGAYQRGLRRRFPQPKEGQS
ncbi:nitrate- and nitrite sensing domain-containing protein [Micromonospora sp. NPDC048999]|uniref:nitrate- and nitrite sensing domain-containing protein n=1 Tax=Micromonospora sp. NPDC048999 TaxID=3155391 RepID=UPI0033EDC31A